MKKLFAVLLSIALVLSMGTIALAADEPAPATGVITIHNAIKDSEYNVYKMLSFEPTGDDASKGVYKIVAGWEDFFASAPATDFFTVTEIKGEKVVSIKEDVDEVSQELAQAAVAYAKNNKINPAQASKTPVVEDGVVSDVVFENLDLGYYAVDTTVGTLCALTNTNSAEDAWEKNSQPDIDKYVQEDSKIGDEKDGWYKVNDANIGQQVDYKSVVTVGYGAINYVMHDKMQDGLAFIEGSVRVVLANGTEVDEDNYTVVYPATDGHTFDVVFTNEFIAGLENPDKVVQFTVYYSAILDDDAIVVDDGNDNTVKLTYGDATEKTWETKEDTTSTFTWKIDVFKFAVDGQDENGDDIIKKLAGAEFSLNLKGSNDVFKFTKIADTVVDGVSIPTYRVDSEGDLESIVTGDTGEFIIVGLDEGIYELTELDAPDGYNKLNAPVTITIKTTYDDKNLEAEYTVNGNAPAQIGVENKTGGLFPETGGIGTTIFYLVGGLLMVAAFVILVSKKRMSTFA
ncbi:MAG: LPXTG cell wall anchor domain-containing protein [Clostridia bacterium]|nr:LPXTG cell wall anchor domain-containing protein [Clostridia bacterium]